MPRPMPTPKSSPRYYLKVGNLTPREAAELLKRVRSGENEVAVEVEIRLRSGKAIPGQIESDSSDSDCREEP